MVTRCVSVISHVVLLQVRKILDLVQSKGEEVSEYFIRVLQKVADAYYDLQPWLDEIGYEPSESICGKPVVNTDPGKATHLRPLPQNSPLWRREVFKIQLDKAPSNLI